MRQSLSMLPLLVALACSDGSSTETQASGVGADAGSMGGSTSVEMSGSGGNSAVIDGSAPMDLLARRRRRIGSGGNAPFTGSGGAAAASGVPGSGGTTATGGVPGSGGTTATGGAPGSGGVAATGGRLGSGGVAATGGTLGSGGVAATGGRPGSGGVAATGGTLGSGGVAATGGTLGSGGVAATGGTSATGGASTGGASASGGSASTGGSVSYSTNFDLTESPISEGGHWHHTDPNQSIVVTSNGLANGTQDASGKNAAGGYNDSMAFLSGFPPDQKVSCVLHRTGSQPGYLEAEIWLRASEGASRSTPFGDTQTYGYEINIEGNGAYIQIGQFKRLPALFDSQTSGSPLTSMGVHDGDVFEADIVGNTITARLNGTVIASATDTGQTGVPAIASGNPGIGFFRQDVSGTIDPQSFCFTSLTAQGL